MSTMQVATRNNTNGRLQVHRESSPAASTRRASHTGTTVAPPPGHYARLALNDIGDRTGQQTQTQPTAPTTAPMTGTSTTTTTATTAPVAGVLQFKEGNTGYCMTCYYDHVARLSVTYAAITLALLALCVATDRWVATAEPPMTSPVTSPAAQNVLRFRIGLLRVCRVDSSDSLIDVYYGADCLWIDHFGSGLSHTGAPLLTNERTSDDEHVLASGSRRETPPAGAGDSLGYHSTTTQRAAFPVFTVGVVHSLRRVAPVLLLALLVTLAAAAAAAVGHCRKSRCTAVAVGLFVLAGLLLASAQLTISSLISEEFRMRPLSPHGVTSYQMGPCFYGTAAAILLAQLTALMSAHAYIRRMRSPDLLKTSGAAGARCEQRQLYVGTHKFQLSNSDVSVSSASGGAGAPLATHGAATLPSRGRYAKHVTFLLDESRPLYTAGQNGGVRSMCDLHQAGPRPDASQV